MSQPEDGRQPPTEADATHEVVRMVSPPQSICLKEVSGDQTERRQLELGHDNGFDVAP